MSYQSLEFIIFSIAVLLVYYIVGPKRQRFVLLAANLLFFLFADPRYLPFVVATTLISFFAAKKIGKIYAEADEKISTGEGSAKELRTASKKQAKRILLFGLIPVLGMLVICKYTEFFVSNINGLLAAIHMKPIEMFKMIVPIGISFYTFMAVGYVLDIYWKRYPAEQNLITYANFAMYFPHVVQGPIDRFNEFKEQVALGVHFDYDQVASGAQLALWGFFKKLVIADRLGLFVDEVLGAWPKQNGLLLALTFAVYSIQIYADFSGCIDIVSGISEMFGIKLRKNFNHPYFSKSMGEFWRRWHISLQEWFKDYLYFPVSVSSFTKKQKKKLKKKGNKRGAELFATCFPILIVWIVTGIWHGAAWKFLAWGLFHAALLIGSECARPVFEKLNLWLHVNTETFGWKLWQMLRTFILCCVGRIFFRANSISDAFGIIKRILLNSNLGGFLLKPLNAYGLSFKSINVALISMLILLVVDNIQERVRIRETLAKENTLFRWIVLLAALLAVIVFGIYGPAFNMSNFIYEQF